MNKTSKTLILWVAVAVMWATTLVGVRFVPQQAEPQKVGVSAPNLEVGTHLEARSSHWPTVRAHHLEAHPVCEACGSKEDLQVHHVEPFHLHPEKELDPTNLITLCGPGGHSCHLRIGHSFNYSAYNPNVRDDAKQQSDRIKNRRTQ